MSNYAYATLRHLALGGDERNRYTVTVITTMSRSDLLLDLPFDGNTALAFTMEKNMSQLDNEEPFSQSLGEMPAPNEDVPSRRSRSSIRKSPHRTWAFLALITYLVGLGSGYLLWGRKLGGNSSKTTEKGSQAHADMGALIDQVNPPDGYQLSIRYGDFAPKLVAAGVIDYAGFVKLYQEIGSPLNEQQINILTKGSDAPVVFNKENQHFLLNLFWALGLANQNRIMTEGMMMRDGSEEALRFASTGGWTISAKPVSEIYAIQPFITLTDEQQKHLEEVASAVYRPCCNNPTIFPDCNHGMAMLGLLELMASQAASTSEMFEAAKYVNAFWFPQQMLELATYFSSAKNISFTEVDSRQAVGKEFFSGGGFPVIHQWLSQNGKLEQAPGVGGNCGVK